MTAAHMNAKVRFVAEWIDKQHVDASGEWLSEQDEYVCTTHSTLEAARAAAVEGSKKAAQAEWIKVREQHYETHDNEGNRWHRWETVKSFTGDYESLEENH